MFSLTCFVQHLTRSRDPSTSDVRQTEMAVFRPASSFAGGQIGQLSRFFGRHILALLVLATNNLPRGRPVSHRSKRVCVFVEILLFAFGPSRQTFHQFGFRRKRIHSGSDLDGLIKSLAV
jgi:hypothetical protein